MVWSSPYCEWTPPSLTMLQCVICSWKKYMYSEINIFHILGTLQIFFFIHINTLTANCASKLLIWHFPLAMGLLNLNLKCVINNCHLPHNLWPILGGKSTTWNYLNITWRSYSYNNLIYTGKPNSYYVNDIIKILWKTQKIVWFHTTICLKRANIVHRIIHFTRHSNMIICVLHLSWWCSYLHVK